MVSQQPKPSNDFEDVLAALESEPGFGFSPEAVTRVQSNTQPARRLAKGHSVILKGEFTQTKSEMRSLI